MLLVVYLRGVPPGLPFILLISGPPPNPFCFSALSAVPCSSSRGFLREVYLSIPSHSGNSPLYPRDVMDLDCSDSVRATHPACGSSPTPGQVCPQGPKSSRAAVIPPMSQDSCPNSNGRLSSGFQACCWSRSESKSDLEYKGLCT